MALNIIARAAGRILPGRNSGKTHSSAFTDTAVPLLTGEDSRQTISVWDVISEGPIEGLVDGTASVFLDNDPIVSPGDEGHVTKTPPFIPSSSTPGLQFTNGSKNVTVGTSSTLSQAVGRVLIVKDVNALTGVSGTKGSSTITISGGVPAEIVNTVTGNPNFTLNDITVEGAGFTNSLTGANSVVYAVTARPSSTTVTTNRRLVKSFSNKSANMTFQVKVASFSGTNTIVLTENWPFASGTYSLTYGTHTIVNPVSFTEATSAYGSTKKVARSTVQFRTGHNVQEPIKEIGSLQGNAISRTTGLNRSMDLHSDYFQWFATTNGKRLSNHTESQGTDSTYIVDSVSDLGLTNSNEVDEIIISFEYGALTNTHWEKGSQEDAYSAFLVDFSYSRDGGSSFTDTTLPVIEHRAKALQGFSVDEHINLEPFQPFDRWKVKIKRITSAGGAGYNPALWQGKPLLQYDASGKRLTDPMRVLTYWRNNAPCKISTLTSIIKNKLSYPYTSYAAITFDSKAYSSMPNRSYLVRGRKIQVPSNYVTREESSTGIASYNRDSNGDIQSSYQDWDGSFRDEVYTNNPAWILYDLIHSKRYGLGRFVEDVDKWSFYRVARYCDEMVPDGKGGEEPRYTCNIAIQKASGARKVIKDLATNFLGLLHWLNGEMYLTADQPSAPVYTFGRGNVIEGRFSYSTTEFKQRPNQYVVIWNNPELDYKQDFVLVEDTESIVERGIVISKDTVAFGCTSRSQAERFGRWRLFTDKLQTRSVSFATSINASFLDPGDLIEIQDANIDNTELSGRISSSGTVSTTTVAIDRNVVLQSGYSYTLNVLFFSPAALLIDDTATINSVTYTKGDIILTTNNGSALTEENVNNLTDEADSSRPVNVNWKPDTHVQSRSVSTNPGTVDSLTVSAAFSAAPTRGTMWTLTSKNNNIIESSSSKTFKVTSVRQTNEMISEITAIEHFNAKFSSIEKNFNLVVEDEDFKGPSSTDIVPSISNLTLSFSNE